MEERVRRVVRAHGARARAPPLGARDGGCRRPRAALRELRRGRPPRRPDLRLHEGGADREGRRRHHHESEDAAVCAAAGGGDGRVDLPGRRRVTCAPCTAYTGWAWGVPLSPGPVTFFF